MRILWLGDAGSSTGFATVTHNIGERLVNKYGHDIHVLAYNHRGDYVPGPLKLYRPNMLRQDDIYGMSRHIELLAKVEPDVVVMLNDANMILGMLLKNAYDPDQILLRYRPILTYIPVDGYNQPPTWSSFLSKYTNVVAMTKHGQAAYPGSQLVYHGVDTEMFHPVADRPFKISSGATVSTKRECKEAFGYDPDCFLVLRVDKNSGRKDFGATWKALVPVMRRHSDIKVHLHTATSGLDVGLDINNVLEREPDLQPRFSTPGLHNSFEGWPISDLVALYNAADIFVSTSRGEGFGLTLAESLACGVPVIAQNVSAMPEVVGPGGVLIEPQRQITVPAGQDLWLSDINAFSDEIEHLYQAGGVRRKLGKLGREHVVRSFSWDTAADKFHDYLSALAEGVVAHGPNDGEEAAGLPDLHGDSEDLADG